MLRQICVQKENTFLTTVVTKTYGSCLYPKMEGFTMIGTKQNGRTYWGMLSSYWFRELQWVWS